MRAYLNFIPDYLRAVIFRWDTLCGILLGGLALSLFLSGVGGMPASITATAIVVALFIEATYGAYRSERIMRSNYESKIHVVARPDVLNINHPLQGEEPLARDEVSIFAIIYFEIWAQIDFHTSNLVLNIVGQRQRRRWQLWKYVLPQYKRLKGIRIEGQDTAIYRHRIRSDTKQPWEDHATFKWRGKVPLKGKDAGWWDSFFLELVVETGIPSGFWRSTVDSRLYERGSTTPL